MPIMTVYEKVVRRRAWKEGIEEGYKEGQLLARVELFQQMLDRGISMEMITKYAALPLEEIVSLLENFQKPVTTTLDRS